jgi:hypothetical protein
MLSTEHAKMSELINIEMAITGATLDRERRDEKELATALKELEHLCHLEKYYKDLLTGEIDCSSTEGVNPVRGCLINPSCLD